MMTPVGAGFGQQLDRFKAVVTKGWAWPSPSIGFSLYVFDAVQEKAPFASGELTPPDTNRLQEAPVLAAVGYTLALRDVEQSDFLLDRWAEGFDRLSSRKVFTPDRESFVYRPLELLGISLGASRNSAITPASKEWFRKVLDEGEQKLTCGGLWQALLGSCAAQAVEKPWHRIVIPEPGLMPVHELALTRWLFDAYPTVFDQGRSTSAASVEQALIEQCATANVTPHDASHASLFYFSLRRAVERLLSAAQERGTQVDKQTPENSNPPRVFISYSHDYDACKKVGLEPEAHKKRVFALAEQLRDEGVLCVIDQQIANPPEGWPRWMMNKIEESDFVLVVSTETYNQRFRGKEEPGKGLGGQWEGAIITQELYESEGKNEKFIPVIFDRADAAHIPLPLRSATHYDVSDTPGYDGLYFYLTHQPAYQPKPLGPIRKRPTTGI